MKQKMADYMEKHKYTLMLIGMGILVITNLMNPIARAFFPEAVEIREEIVEELVGDVIDDRLVPIKNDLYEIRSELKQIQQGQEELFDYAVNLLGWECNQYDTAEQINARIDMWIDQRWGAQLVALRYIGSNTKAREALKGLVAYEEVYQAIVFRALKY